MSYRKAILVAGLGNNIPKSIAQRVQHFDPSKIVENAKADMAAAKELGYDMEGFFADPANAAKSFQEYQEKLNSRKWDGIIVGGGLRGAMELTELFEQFVNASIEAHPGVKFGFSTSPSELLKVAQRIFPDAKP